MSEIKNFAGLPPHRTDVYVHWQNKDQVGTMKKLREAYDRLAEHDKDALEFLLDAVYDAGRSDEFDSNCPDI